MWKKIIIIISIIASYLLICHKIYSKFTNTTYEQIITQITQKQVIPQKKEKPIGLLIIEKINLKEELYSMNSLENTIEKHVTILNYSSEPSIKNSTIFIAAHSGTGKIAYFEELDKLSIDDKIILKYKDITYTYKVKDIWEDKKNGTINVPKENTNQLILTTCSPTKDSYQLIINCLLI